MDDALCRYNCEDLAENCLGYGMVNSQWCYLWVTSTEVSHPGFWAFTSSPAWTNDHEITHVDSGWHASCYKKVMPEDSQGIFFLDVFII